MLFRAYVLTFFIKKFFVCLKYGFHDYVLSIKKPSCLPQTMRFKKDCFCISLVLWHSLFLSLWYIKLFKSNKSPPLWLLVFLNPWVVNWKFIYSSASLGENWPSGELSISHIYTLSKHKSENKRWLFSNI